MIYILSTSRPLGSICKFQLDGVTVDIRGNFFGYARLSSSGQIYSIYTNPDNDYLTSTAEMPAGTYNLTLIARVELNSD